MARQEPRGVIPAGPGGVGPMTLEAIRAHVAATAGRRRRTGQSGVAFDEPVAMRRRRPAGDHRADAVPLARVRQPGRETGPARVAGETALLRVARAALL